MDKAEKEVEREFATLTISNEPGKDVVTIDVKFSPKRSDIDDENTPVSFRVMDFISNYAILPYVGMAEEILMTQEASDSVN